MVAKSSAERKRKQRKLNTENPDRKNRKLDSVFMFNSVEIAVILDLDNNVWFRGVDLARALEMDSPCSAVCHHIDKKYTQSYEQLSKKNPKYRNIPNIHPATTFVSEAGMYKFIIRSRKPKAEKFSEWVCSKLLPKTRAIQRQLDVGHVFEVKKERFYEH